MWIWLLGVALLAVLLAAAAFMQVKRSAREAQDNERRLSQRIEVLEKELSAMMDGAFGVASQLKKVKGNLKNTVQQQEQMRQRDMGNLPYNEAVRRVSKGADVDELVEHCGLSRAEAELVEMLHKKSSPPLVDEPAIAVPEVAAQESFVQPPTIDPEDEPLGADSSQPEEDDESLFSGDLGGDDFQQALERAREFQTQPIAPAEDDSSAGEQVEEPDDRH